LLYTIRLQFEIHTATTRKKSKQQSSCVAACHGRKRENKTTIKLCGLSRLQGKKSNQPLWPVASARGKKNNLVSQVASREGKNNNLAASTETNNKLVLMAANKQTKNTTTINRCGLLRPQQEKKQSKTTIILCGGLSRPQARKQNNNQTVRPLTAARKKRQSTFAACRVCKKKKKNNQLVSRVASREGKKQPCRERGKQQSTCVRGRKHKKNEQQSTGAACCGRKKKNPEKKTTIILCGGLLSRPTAASTIVLCGACHGRKPKKSNCAASRGRNQKQQSTFAACRLQGEEKTTINL